MIRFKKNNLIVFILAATFFLFVNVSTSKAYFEPGKVPVPGRGDYHGDVVYNLLWETGEYSTGRQSGYPKNDRFSPDRPDYFCGNHTKDLVTTPHAPVERRSETVTYKWVGDPEMDRGLAYELMFGGRMKQLKGNNNEYPLDKDIGQIELWKSPKHGIYSAVRDYQYNVFGEREVGKGEEASALGKPAIKEMLLDGYELEDKAEEYAAFFYAILGVNDGVFEVDLIDDEAHTLIDQVNPAYIVGPYRLEIKNLYRETLQAAIRGGKVTNDIHKEEYKDGKGKYSNINKISDLPHSKEIATKVEYAITHLPEILAGQDDFLQYRMLINGRYYVEPTDPDYEKLLPTQKQKDENERFKKEVLDTIQFLDMDGNAIPFPEFGEKFYVRMKPDKHALGHLRLGFMFNYVKDLNATASMYAVKKHKLDVRMGAGTYKSKKEPQEIECSAGVGIRGRTGTYKTDSCREVWEYPPKSDPYLKYVNYTGALVSNDELQEIVRLIYNVLPTYGTSVVMGYRDVEMRITLGGNVWKENPGLKNGKYNGTYDGKNTKGIKEKLAKERKLLEEEAKKKENKIIKKEKDARDAERRKNAEDEKYKSDRNPVEKYISSGTFNFQMETILDKQLKDKNAMDKTAFIRKFSDPKIPNSERTKFKDDTFIKYFDPVLEHYTDFYRRNAQTYSPYHYNRTFDITEDGYRRTFDNKKDEDLKNEIKRRHLLPSGIPYTDINVDKYAKAIRVVNSIGGDYQYGQGSTSREGINFSSHVDLDSMDRLINYIDSNRATSYTHDYFVWVRYGKDDWRRDYRTTTIQYPKGVVDNVYYEITNQYYAMYSGMPSRSEVKEYDDGIKKIRQKGEKGDPIYKNMIENDPYYDNAKIYGGKNYKGIESLKDSANKVEDAMSKLAKQVNDDSEDYDKMKEEVYSSVSQTTDPKNPKDPKDPKINNNENPFPGIEVMLLEFIPHFDANDNLVEDNIMKGSKTKLEYKYRNPPDPEPRMDSQGYSLDTKEKIRPEEVELKNSMFTEPVPNDFSKMLIADEKTVDEWIALYNPTKEEEKKKPDQGKLHTNINDIHTNRLENSLYAVSQTICTDENGHYEFKHLNPFHKYRVVFIYNGQYYQDTYYKNYIGAPGGYSNASEEYMNYALSKDKVAHYRKNFNHQFFQAHPADESYEVDGHRNIGYAFDLQLTDKNHDRTKVKLSDALRKFHELAAGIDNDNKGNGQNQNGANANNGNTANNTNTQNKKQNNANNKDDKSDEIRPKRSYTEIFEDFLKYLKDNQVSDEEAQRVLQYLLDTLIKAMTPQSYPVFHRFAIEEQPGYDPVSAQDLPREKDHAFQKPQMGKDIKYRTTFRIKKKQYVGLVTPIMRVKNNGQPLKKTQKYEVDLPQYTKNKEVLEVHFPYLYSEWSDQRYFVDFGVYFRAVNDIGLMKDLYKVKVIVNGKAQDYRYMARNPENDRMWYINTRFTNKGYFVDKYVREVRKSDYLNYAGAKITKDGGGASETPDPRQMQVYATYLIQMRNLGCLDLQVDEVVDYYDANQFTFDGIKKGDIYEPKVYDKHDGKKGTYVQSFIGKDQNYHRLDGEKIRISTKSSTGFDSGGKGGQSGNGGANTDGKGPKVTKPGGFSKGECNFVPLYISGIKAANGNDRLKVAPDNIKLTMGVSDPSIDPKDKKEYAKTQYTVDEMNKIRASTDKNVYEGKANLEVIDREKQRQEVINQMNSASKAEQTGPASADMDIGDGIPSSKPANNKKPTGTILPKGDSDNDADYDNDDYNYEERFNQKLNDKDNKDNKGNKKKPNKPVDKALEEKIKNRVTRDAYIYLTFKVNIDPETSRVKLDQFIRNEDIKKNIKPDAKGKPGINEKNGKRNLAEVNSYRTYYPKGTKLPNKLGKQRNQYIDKEVAKGEAEGEEAGIFDKNSICGNLREYNIDEKGDIIAKRAENDMDGAPAFKLKIANDKDNLRRFKGFAFEDSRNVDINGAIIGNGIWEKGETKINGVGVELVELRPEVDKDGLATHNYVEEVPWEPVKYTLNGKKLGVNPAPNSEKYPRDEDGNDYYWTGRKEALRVITGPPGTIFAPDKNDGANDNLGEGDYAITDLPSGDFYIKFTYGNSDRTVLGTSYKIDPKDADKLGKDTMIDFLGKDKSQVLNAKSYNGSDFKVTQINGGKTPAGRTFNNIQKINLAELNDQETKDNHKQFNRSKVFGNNINNKNKGASPQKLDKEYYHVQNLKYVMTELGKVKSYAIDDEERRKSVVGYGTDRLNYKDEVLSSFEKVGKNTFRTDDEKPTGEYNQDEMKKYQQKNLIADLKKNTSMYAYTGVFQNEIEKFRNHTNKQKKNNANEYEIDGLNIGLVERPKSQLMISKKVENVSIKVGTQQNIINQGIGNPDDFKRYNGGSTENNGNSLKNNQNEHIAYFKHKSHKPKYGKYGYITLLPELNYYGKMSNGEEKETITAYLDDELNNLDLTAKYEFRITNIGEIDYKSWKFYYTGKKNEGDPKSVTTPIHVLDYVNNKLKFSPERDENKDWSVYEANVLLGFETKEGQKIDEKYEKAMINNEFADRVRTYHNIIVKELNKGLLPEKINPNVDNKEKPDEKSYVDFELVLTKSITADGADSLQPLEFPNLTEICHVTNDQGRRMYYSILGNQPMAYQAEKEFVPDKMLGGKAVKSFDTIVPEECDADSSQKIKIMPPTGRNKQLLPIVISTIVAGLIILMIVLKTKNKSSGNGKPPFGRRSEIIV